MINIIDYMKTSVEDYNRKLNLFNIGDEITIHLITNDKKINKQLLTGIVIKKRGSGINKTFTIRKLSYSISIEMTYFLYSPLILKIIVNKLGKVNKSKLYYLRKLKRKN